MRNNTKQFEVCGKKYILTVKRSMVFNLMKVVPELFNIAKKSDLKKGGNKLPTNENGEIDFESIINSEEYDAGNKIYDNIDVLFYEMIKVAQPNITKEKSDEIYDAFYDKYENADEELLNFMYESFRGGISKEKEKLNW